MKQFPYVYRFSDPRYYGVRTFIGSIQAGHSMKRTPAMTDEDVRYQLDEMERELRADYRAWLKGI